MSPYEKPWEDLKALLCTLFCLLLIMDINTLLSVSQLYGFMKDKWNVSALRDYGIFVSLNLLICNNILLSMN